MNKIQVLIKWLEEIQEGKSPLIPYNLHTLVSGLIHHFGTTDAIEHLKQLDKTKLD